MQDRRQLIIARHGKSSWKQESIKDIDRHLKERGIHDAYKMANRLNDNTIHPEILISSPATRALHTAMIFARTLNHPLDQVQLQEIFYTGDEQDVLDVVRQTPDSNSSVMIFGHNPTFTDLANLFLSQELDNLPTSGIVAIEFETGQWQEIGKANLRDEWVDYPKKK